MTGPVLLVNPNGNAATTGGMLEIACEACPGLSLHGVTMAGQPPVIATSADLDGAACAVATLAVPPECKGVIVAAFGDPGRADLAERLDCPVVGIAQAGMQAAAAGGRRFSVATTTPDLVSRIVACAEAYGLGGLLLSVRVTEGPPLEVMADPDRLHAEMRKAVAHCVLDGAEAVVIGGGPLAMVARKLASEASVPLIEPVPEAARRMLAALNPA